MKFTSSPAALVALACTLVIPLAAHAQTALGESVFNARCKSCHDG